MNEEIIKDVGALEVEAEHLKEGQEEIKEEVDTLQNNQKWFDDRIEGIYRRLNELIERVTLLEAEAAEEENNEEMPPDVGEILRTDTTETIIENFEKPDAPQKEKRRSIFGII